MLTERELKALGKRPEVINSFGVSVELRESSCSIPQNHILEVEVCLPCGKVEHAVLKFPCVTRANSATCTNLPLERAALLACADSGLPIPRMIAYGEGGEWLMMTRLTGSPLSDITRPVNRLDAIVEIARVLALVHHTTFPQDFTRSEIPTITSIERLNLVLENAYTLEHPDSSLIITMLKTLELCDDQNCVFLHGDLSAANILTTELGEVGVVDWENSHFGPREEDLAYAMSSTSGVCMSKADRSLFISSYRRFAGVELSPTFKHFQLFDALQQTVNMISTCSDHRGLLRAAKKIYSQISN